MKPSNNNHFMVIYLKEGCPISLTFAPWRQHNQDDAKNGMKDIWVGWLTI